MTGSLPEELNNGAVSRPIPAEKGRKPPRMYSLCISSHFTVHVRDEGEPGKQLGSVARHRSVCAPLFSAQTPPELGEPEGARVGKGGSGKREERTPDRSSR
ncbi:hypothetical protein DMENIID0001_148840 [Sergentomyia squamirostris]